MAKTQKHTMLARSIKRQYPTAKISYLRKGWRGNYNYLCTLVVGENTAYGTGKTKYTSLENATKQSNLYGNGRFAKSQWEEIPFKIDVA